MSRKLAIISLAIGLMPPAIAETVCEIFADLDSHSERSLILSGELIISSEIAVLGAADCENEYTTPLGGPVRLWPTGVRLTLSPSLSADQRSRLQETAAEADRLRASGRPVAATGSFEGRLHTEPMDDFPAYLEIEFVRDIDLQELPRPEELPVLSVCDLFKDLPSWNGQRVAVRGEFVSTFEGAWLSGRNCSYALETGGYRWPTTLVFGQPGYYASSIDPLLRIPQASTPVEQDATLRGRNTVINIATYVGRVRTHPRGQYFAVCREGGDWVRNGFGHLNAAAAELWEETVFDFERRPAPMPDRNDNQATPCTPPNQAELCATTPALATAAARGCFDRVAELLSTQGIDSANGSESAALDAAIRRGDREIVQLLLDYGAPVNPTPRPFTTPLEEAANRSRFEILELLIDRGADPNRPDDRGRPFLPKLGYFDPQVTRLLLEAGADPNARNDDGTTALMRASAAGYEHSIRILLDHGALPNLVDLKGRTALMHAASGKYVDAIPLLLDTGADPSLKNALGQTAAELARQAGNDVAVEMLLAAEAARR